MFPDLMGHLFTIHPIIPPNHKDQSIAEPCLLGLRAPVHIGTMGI
jgi:hypothetical protein